MNAATESRRRRWVALSVAFAVAAALLALAFQPIEALRTDPLGGFAVRFPVLV